MASTFTPTDTKASAVSAPAVKSIEASSQSTARARKMIPTLSLNDEPIQMQVLHDLGLL